MQLENINQKNFSYKEFFFSQTAIDNNIDNQAELFKDIQYKALILNGVHLATTLQQIRDVMNANAELKEIVKNDEIIININSGYRCPELNKLVGSRPTSQHPKFQAADFRINGITDLQQLKRIALWLKKQKVPVDQCLVEKTWIHLSVKLNDNRREFGTFINNTFTKF
tara:strand:- start:838 stop:1341 length:504 start_codon:yes stop_codon:yes gene_type:complete